MPVYLHLLFALIYLLTEWIHQFSNEYIVYVCPLLDICQVSQWYELVVFTASMEIYGSAVADKLDNNRDILIRRYYRQVKTPWKGILGPVIVDWSCLVEVVFHVCLFNYWTCASVSLFPVFCSTVLWI